MKHSALYVILAAAALVFTGCDKENGDDPVKVHTSYTNPVCSLSLPDPTVIRADDGNFYAFATEDIAGIPIMKSPNLIDWTQVDRVFNTAYRPKLDGTQTGGLWAPCVAKLDDTYLLYYSYAPSNSILGWSHGIGVCTAKSLAGPWKDRGKILIGSQIGVQYSIDPFFFREDGKNWLTWGSYFGIWLIELSDDGLSIKEGAQPKRLAGTDGYGLEGSMIYKKDGYYYLFLSEGGYEYSNNAYKLGVLRSTSLDGPYYNKAGKTTTPTSEGGEAAAVDFFLRGGDGFVSPGHCSEILVDDNGVEWILYHAYVEGQEEAGRALMLDYLSWEDGWPFIGEGSGYPTVTSTKVPVFN